MNPSHQVRRSKLEVTQLSHEKYNQRHESVTPPKFRTSQNNCVHTQATSRHSSRYQTLQHRTNPAHTQVSRDSSIKRKQKNLYIDTDLINKQFELGAGNPKKQHDTTPLFASEDSVTLLHRIQNKRKNTQVCYDNLIDAIKLGYNKEQEGQNIINLSDSKFQTTQGRAIDSNINSRVKANVAPEHPQKALIKNVLREVNELKSEIGNNSKLKQIEILLGELEQQLDGKRRTEGKNECRTSLLQANQIENSLMLKSYASNSNSWFSKQRKENIPRKVGYQNQRVKTAAEEKERERQRDKGKGNFRSKSPLRQILNYVNKKR